MNVWVVLESYHHDTQPDRSICGSRRCWQHSCCCACLQVSHCRRKFNSRILSTRAGHEASHREVAVHEIEPGYTLTNRIVLVLDRAFLNLQPLPAKIDPVFVAAHLVVDGIAISTITARVPEAISHGFEPRLLVVAFRW